LPQGINTRSDLRLLNIAAIEANVDA